MKKVLTLAVLLITVIAAAALAADTTKPAASMEKPAAAAMKAQEKCPITGMPINKTFYTDFEGSRIYFCSDKCVVEFKKDPAKFIQKMKDEGIQLEKTPVEPPKTEMKTEMKTETKTDTKTDTKTEAVPPAAKK